ncbi:Phosphate ABC transporter, periplasmic phosphate-binding protein PstS (TC 3.A.1.7.1) [hydrothermal vent metagenome]|uniref:Phosphate ABC transporter, periplasmic phosphate-binding protein PstS (TC 3.A.1.7.1) n=1 Tax=hydrothermal vent metagenome TaxID=652676 RepID=A0A3B1BQ58_9ZZZZ
MTKTMLLRRYLTLSGLLLSLLCLKPVMADSLPAQGQGRVLLTGSTSLSNLVTFWAQSFHNANPNIAITVADPGSAAGIDALLNGTANAVLLSTPLSPGQREQFIQHYAYPPTLIPVAKDGVAVYVNNNNPLKRISLQQLDAIYSSNRRCGAAHALRNWKTLGLSGPIARAKITPFGLSVTSGAYYLFKQQALCGGDFRPDFQALAGPAAIETALSENPAAIAFSSSAMHSASIRAVPVARQNNGPAIFPSISNIQNGRYPLARQLAIAINVPHGKQVNPALHRFINYARSALGQSVAARAGYAPLTAK